MTAGTEYDEDDDEALAREAELAADEPEEDDGELATPLPGFTYDPMLGVVGGVGALEGRPDAPRLVGRWPGPVLLEVSGRRAGVGALVLTAVGLLVFLALAFLALELGEDLAGVLPWPVRPSVLVTAVVCAVVAGGFALALALQLVAQGARVVFTTDGIGTSARSGDAFVPWSAVRGYRPGHGAIVVETETGSLLVPVRDEDQADEVMTLLDDRQVHRLV